MNSEVVQAEQSPLNKQRWLCKLSCGCEVWFTAKTKPARVRHTCHPDLKD